MNTIEELNAIAREELAKIKGKELGNKERMAIPQQEMPSRNPKERARQMAEVALGYTEEQAVVEANRCLQCKNKPCISGCPVNVQIPEFIAEIAKGEFKKAVDIIKQTSLLPAICGRVCPQEKQCQGQCTVGKVYKSGEKAVSIGRLERFVADWERENKKVTMPEIAPKTGKKVAVIGAGPAGLTVAADCARAGHSVTVFEAFHKAGGVMMYGIPEFRLPKAIVQEEIDNLKKMGVDFECNFLVGRTDTLDQLLTEKGFDVLLMTDEVDSFVPQTLGKYADKDFRSVTQEDLGLSTDEEKKEAAEQAEKSKATLEFVKKTLGDAVKEVRLSDNLGTHPVCMVPEEGMNVSL